MKFTVTLRVSGDIDMSVDAVGPKEAENFARVKFRARMRGGAIALSDVRFLEDLRPEIIEVRAEEE